MRWIVAKLPGAVFLDPFAGSGTTLVAAIEDGREAVGIETDSRYHAMTMKRILASSREAAERLALA